MSSIKVKIGFVPSYRFRYTPWCQKMRDDSLAAFANTKAVFLFCSKCDDSVNIAFKIDRPWYISS